MAKYRFELINMGMSSYSLAPRLFIKKTANDIPVEIRYVPSTDKIFVDEQKGYEKHNGEVIEFPDRGYFELDDSIPSNKVLINYLKLYPTNAKNSAIYPHIKAMYREIEVTKAAQKEVKDITEMLDILNNVVILSEDELRKTAFLCNLLTVANMNTEDLHTVRAKLVKYTQSNHLAVAEIMNDSLAEEKTLVVDALSLGLLVSENEKMSVISFDNGQVLARNILGESALKDAAIALQKDEAKRKALRVRVSQVKNGTTSYSEEKQNLLKDIEVKEAVGKMTYPQLVKLACDMLDDNKETPFVQTGATYVLTGYEDIKLTYVDPNGQKVQGKKGVRLFLEANEDKMKTPLAISMSSFV
jgi:hypothetical protein